MKRAVAGLAIAVLAVQGLGGASMAGGQEPDGGALSYVACISSDTDAGPCTMIAGHTVGGIDTGLETLTSVAVSPDGGSVYTASQLGDAVGRFDRAEDGNLTYRGCITSNSDVTGCTPIDGATSDGTGTGLDHLQSVAVSPDGTSVYTASMAGDAVGRFDRANDGNLTYRGCITSNSDVTGCTPIPGPTSGGTDTGLSRLMSVAVSPDGHSVYTASYMGDAVGRFDRADDGNLTYRGCITSNSDVTGCTTIDGATAGGTDTGLDYLMSVAVSPDGGSVYTASSAGDAAGRFDRADDGNLNYQGCITSNSGVTGCTPIPGATANGTDTGLNVLRSVVVSPDGGSVYTASDFSDAVGQFDRADDGNLTYRGCITSNSGVTGCTPIPGATATGTDTGLDGLRSVAVSPDGRSVYTASDSGDAVGRFDRADDDTLTYHACVTSNSDVTGCTPIGGATAGGADTGLNRLTSVAVSPDGTSVYTASDFGDAVARFDRVLPPESEPKPPPAPAGVVRLDGTTRFDTAAVVALDRFDPDQVHVVYLATGLNFPDALAGGPLAADHHAPILLTGTDHLPDETADALATLAPDRVVALGGAAVLADQVLTEAAAAASGADTDRIFGPDRFATATAVADTLGPSDTAFLSTGLNFPDALAASAATAGAPILLATPTSLPDPTRESLTVRDPEQIMALGGEVALDDQVLDAAATAADGADTDRIFGPDRFATAVDIAATFADPDTVYVATGLNFPDALAAGPAAVSEHAPIVLVTTDTVPDIVHAYLSGLPDLRRIVILGGTVAISDNVQTTLQNILDP